MKRVVIAAAVLLAAACTPKSDEGSRSEKAASGGPTATARLPARFTIVSRHSGMETGTSTQHFRDNGRHMAVIQETTMVLQTGDAMRTRMRTIAEQTDTGLRTIMIDLDTGETTAMTVPAQDASKLQSSITTFGKQAWATGRRTGEKGSFAGYPCDYWELEEPFPMRFCVGAHGLALYTRTQVMGSTNEVTVTELRLGDGGPDSAFAYDASRVVEQQSMRDMMDEMMGR